MVIRRYVRCQACDALYQLKLQMDESIHMYAWPIRFHCVDCGDRLEMTYSYKGILPTYYDEDIKDYDCKSYILGFSAAIPITADAYLKEVNREESMILFSPFFNINSFVSRIEDLSIFGQYVKKIQTEVIAKHQILEQLLPIMRKGNVAAFQRKIHTYTVYKNVTVETHAEMQNLYAYLVWQIYKTIAGKRYLDEVYGSFLSILEIHINALSKSDILLLKQSLDSCRPIGKWYKEEAYPYIAELINCFSSLLPVTFCTVMGDKFEGNKSDLRLVTITSKEAVDFYARGYEVFVHGFTILAGIKNHMQKGSVDTFTNPKMKGINTLDMFAKLPGGTIEDKIEDDQALLDYLQGSMNRKIRNAFDHEGIKYDALTQKVTCEYDYANKSKIFELQLVELCEKVYLQLLHIMEISHLSYEIIKRTRE